MINADFYLPRELGSTRWKTKSGMKSGWVLTALDNSIIHAAIIHSFMESYSYKFQFIVYGDDILLQLPKNAKYKLFLEQLLGWYKAFNLLIKEETIPEEPRKFYSCVFLSKHFFTTSEGVLVP